MSSSIFADLLTNNFPHSQDTDSDTDDLSSLPFPQPISRQLFSSPDFNTESFLLSHAQFRTLDDLRSELRSWVDKLKNEMELLIEQDWQGYLSLGKGLIGGESVVRDAERRVRLVERDVQVPPLLKITDQNAKLRIERRILEVDVLLQEKKRIRMKAV
jgi:COG (conserved oligomeric Golgi) complex component, COG2